MRAALVDGHGRVLVRRADETPSDDDTPTELIDLVASVAAADGAQATHCVFGLPGAVDYEAGRLLWAPHLPESWPERLSEASLSQRLGRRVRVANDADLAAVGEAAFGAGRGSTDVAFVTISTGIGAGVVHAGRLVHGRQSGAEVGHTVIDWRAWRDGSAGTLEELGSGSGLARRAREAGLGDIDARAVASAAADGDETATAIWHDAITVCAAGVVNVVMAYSPDVVVIGGGLGLQPAFFEPLRELVFSGLRHHRGELRVLPAALGDDAGLAGAAAWEAAVAPSR
jgi:glucokinase